MTGNAEHLLRALVTCSLRTEACNLTAAHELCSEGLATVMWECQDSGTVLSPTARGRLVLEFS